MVIEQQQTHESAQERVQKQTDPVRQAIFAIEGMTCASCSMRVEKSLKKAPGVFDAQVNLATEKATVMYDPTQTEIGPLAQKVEAVGYKAVPLLAPLPLSADPPSEQEAHTVLVLEGMTCASCAMRIEKGLKKVPGVLHARWQD